ncbi:response regulator [Granulosicoccus antarcticus]|uniref:histidine kinase n=1 Tax=Granulosicoccus antarcticus IMCC3135 TaxID=1192854 RepID=A0A2Z2NM12_9GAMM|nr:response regulator [Granulosicoccus antarcticus]ASJ72209.1 Autoinducer 2 sensor kinase/phosphatase LuxQ [Granulosicoccus antarcticus IMCC3135]
MEPQGEVREVNAALQRALFDDALSSWLLALIIFFSTVAFFYDRVADDALLYWSIAAVAVFGLRLALIFWARAHHDRPLPVLLFTALMALTGMWWGSIALLWSPQLELADQFIIAVLPVIAALGAVVSLGHWPVCYQVFIAGVLAGLVLCLKDIIDESFFRVLVPVALISAGCLYLAYRFHQQKRETLLLRLRNQRALLGKDEFLTRMSHELRTPMNGVLGMVRMLGKTSLSREQQSLVETLNVSGEEMLELVSDLLDAASLASQDIKLVIDGGDLGNITQEVVDVSHSKLRGKPVALTLDIDPGFPPFVLVDSQRWRQICQKLLSNAVKFTEQGEITIQLIAEGDMLELSICDTGCGIPASDLKAVRQLFHQVPGNSKRPAGGSGIGLTIVQGLVDLMDGSLQIDSEPGHGTVVAVRVPLNPVDMLSPPVTRMSRDAATLADSEFARQIADVQPVLPVRTLVAEDNPINQLVIEAALEDLGCDITVVENGLEALLALQASSYDIIFMDCQMPELDGYEATRQARENGCTIPIIAVTANAMAGDRERCLEAGMDDYVIKPIAEGALQQMLDKWLSKPNSKPIDAIAA